MKKITKKTIAFVLALTLSLVLVPSVSAKADEAKYQWGPFKVTNAIKEVSIPTNVSEKIFFAGDTGKHILVTEDYFELEFDYDRMGWKPDDFYWGDDPAKLLEESRICQIPCAIGVCDDEIGWENTAVNIPVVIDAYTDPKGVTSYAFNKEEFVTEYEEYEDDYWLWAFGVTNVEDDYFWEGIILMQSEYDILMGRDFPVVSEKLISASTPAKPDNTTVSFTKEAEGTVYRFLLPENGKHLYTTDVNECKALLKNGWVQELSSGISAKEGIGVYRIFNEQSGEHLYTSDKNEVKVLSKNGWSIDNGGEPLFYGVDGGNKAVYRLFNPSQPQVASHHYTSDQNEINILLNSGWEYDNGGNAVYFLN